MRRSWICAKGWRKPLPGFADNLAALAGYAGMIALALVLMALLIVREVARVSTSARWQMLARLLTIAIVPLLLIFLAAVTLRITNTF